MDNISGPWMIEMRWGKEDVCGWRQARAEILVVIEMLSSLYQCKFPGCDTVT